MAGRVIPDARPVPGLPTLVVFASTTFQGHQLYDQRLATRLLPDHRVYYVEPSQPVVRVGHRRPESGADVRWRREQDGVTVLVPRMLPFGRRPALARLTALVDGLQVRLALARDRHRRAEVVVVVGGHPGRLHLFGETPAVALVKDDYAAGAELIHVDARSVIGRRRELLRRCVAAVVVSPALRDIIATEADLRVEVIPAGCEPDQVRHEEPESLTGLAGPRAVFIGLISDRIDFDLLLEVARAGIALVVVGRQQRTFTNAAALAELAGFAHVRMIDELASDEVQAVLQWCDVGLVPYRRTAFNAASFPLKTLEYLAAGVPVVATDLPAVRWLDTPLAVVADDDAFVSTVHEVAHRGERTTTVEQCRAFARQHSWAARAAAWRGLLGEVLDQRPGRA